MRQEKQYLLDGLSSQMAHYGDFVLVKYERVKANRMNQFRRAVAQLGGSVEVLKKRILLKACAAQEVSFLLKELPGHIGVVFSGKDPVETAKLIFAFRKETEKSVDVVAGRFEGKLCSGQDVEMLSRLPGKEGMRAQFLATLEAPMAQTLAVMEALLSSVAYCLDNKAKLDNKAEMDQGE